MKKDEKAPDPGVKPHNRRLKASPIGQRARAWLEKLKRKGKQGHVL